MRLPAFSRRSPDGWLVRISVRVSGSDCDRLGLQTQAVRDALAQRMVNAARPGDDRTVLAQDQYLLVIRMGRRSGDSNNPVPVVRRLLEGLAEPLDSPVGPIFPRLNAAFTLTPCEASNESVRAALAVALSDAERAGSGVVVQLDLEAGSSQMMTLDTPETEMVSVLKRAIDGDQVVMHYQPVARLSDGRVNAFEALMRVVDENGTGLLYPGQFIAVAERSGLIHELGRIALRAAAVQMESWRAKFGANAPLRVAVNVAPPQLANLEFVREARLAFAEVGLDALTLELTETEMIQEMPQARTTLNALRADGAWIALDDFGVEYSNLSYLRDLAVDIVKIDRSFLDGAANNARATIILAKIVELAHSLDAQVVAEGVIDEPQAAALREMGVDYGQGALFGLAEVAEEAEKRIAAQAVPPSADKSSGDTPSFDKA